MANHFLDIPSWDPVHVTVREWQRIGRYFRPHGGVAQYDFGDGLRHGRTLWSATSRGRKFGLCWSWREVLPRVAALSDPMGIVSNVWLCEDEEGAPVTEPRRLLYLNAAVNQLSWQDNVLPAPPTRVPGVSALVRRSSAAGEGRADLR